MSVRVVVRADATPLIGSGHVMRCTALVGSLRALGADVEFVGTGLPPRAALELQSSGAATSTPAAVWPDSLDVAHVLAAAAKGSAATRWVVVDGYHFDRRYMDALSATGLRVAWVDDLNTLGHFDCDVLINPTLGAERAEYDARPGAAVLAGGTYALLRPPFRRRGTVAGTTRLVVALGGADPLCLTPHVVQRLGDSRLQPCEILVVVGPSNPHVEDVRRAAAGHPHISVVQDPPDWPALVRDAALVIAAAGTTAWELASLRVPMLLISVADNQERGAAAIEEAGGAEVIRARGVADLAGLTDRVEALWRDPDRRRRLACRSGRLIDGRGADRVARWIVHGSEADRVVMRAASADDALQVWRINSEASVRAQSFSPAPIPLAAHFSWFDRQLASPASRSYVFVRDDEAAAVIRYDRAADRDVAELSFAVASPFRGQGLGVRALQESVTPACAALGVRAARGLVIEDNVASIAAFRRAGFIESGRHVRDGRECLVFERVVA